MRVPSSTRAGRCAPLASVIVAFVSCTSLVLAQASNAHHPGRVSARSGRSVQVHLIGDLSASEALADLIPEWFGQEGLPVVLKPQAALGSEDVLATPDPSDAVHVWITLVTPRHARAYFSHPRGKRYLVREVPLQSGLDELGREQLVQMLLSTARAFADHRISSSVADVKSSFSSKPASDGPTAVLSAPDSSIAQTRPTIAESPTQAGAPSSSALAPPARGAYAPEAVSTLRTVHWDPRFGALLGASLQSEQTPQYALGVLLGLRRTSGNAILTVTAKAQYTRTSNVTREHVVITSDTLGLRLTAASDFWARGALRLGCELGVGVDHTRFNSQIEMGFPLVARGAGTDWRPAGVLGLTASITDRVWRWSLGAGITAYSVRAHYDVGIGDQTVQIYSPWLVQPGLWLEAAWH